jgi:hypothetical protein
MRLTLSATLLSLSSIVLASEAVTAPTRIGPVPAALPTVAANTAFYSCSGTGCTGSCQFFDLAAVGRDQCKNPIFPFSSAAIIVKKGYYVSENVLAVDMSRRATKLTFIDRSTLGIKLVEARRRSLPSTFATIYSATVLAQSFTDSTNRSLE